jgi:hypothetical protein
MSHQIHDHNHRVILPQPSAKLPQQLNPDRILPRVTAFQHSPPFGTAFVSEITNSLQGDRMKKFVTFAMLGMFAAALAGCKASGSVGANDPNGGYDKKTVTETSPNGQTQYHKTTETKTDTNQ